MHAPQAQMEITWGHGHLFKANTVFLNPRMPFQSQMHFVKAMTLGLRYVEFSKENLASVS